jgi:hypothetical protein
MRRTMPTMLGLVRILIKQLLLPTAGFTTSTEMAMSVLPFASFIGSRISRSISQRLGMSVRRFVGGEMPVWEEFLVTMGRPTALEARMTIAGTVG